MSSAVEVHRLSKLYRIGLNSGGYRTFRESLTGLLLAPWRRLRRFSGVGRDRSGADTIWALRDVSFRVEPGEIVGIIGRNGAGKSTLLKLLSRVTEPTSGGAVLHGRVGSLLEVGTGFHPELTGRENIFLNGAILGMSRREICRKFDEIVAFAEVEDFLDTPVKRYSSGMYVRLAFAVAAHLEPEILIIDEVLAVGDMEFQRKCLGKMNQVARSGRTVLLVSHNMATVQNLCTTAILLSGGRLQHAGDVSEVLATYLQSARSEGDEGWQAAKYRAPDMLPIFQSIVLRNDQGQPADRFQVGAPMTIEMHYDSPVPLNQPVFGVLVQKLTGEPLFHLQTLSQHKAIPSLPGTGIVRCHVPFLPLMIGSYTLSFVCSTLHTEGNLDYLERAMTIAVAGADVFGTGRLPPARNGSVIVPAQWSFPPAGEGSPVKSAGTDTESDRPLIAAGDCAQ